MRRYEIRQLQAFRAAGKIHETAAQLEKLRAEQQQSVEIGAVDLVVVTIAQRPDNTVRAMGRAGRIDLQRCESHCERCSSARKQEVSASLEKH